ncbi:MAG: hypothetical protein ACI8S6_000436 [Myxococcota bacterium]|jgi:hypothetical protein
MRSVAGSLRGGLFGLPLSEVEGDRRGFRPGAARPRLDRVAKCVVHAYNLGLQSGDPEHLGFLLEMLEPELRGFAYEGGAMGMVTADLWGISRNRLERYVQGPAANHAYMSYVGAGLALGIFHRNPLTYMERLDPFTKWLVLNGYGFCHGYFSTARAIEKQVVPARITGPAARAYDAGLGRALWFVDAAQPEALAKTVARFEPQRHAALWSGIGLACAYASGIDRQQLVALRQAAGAHSPWLAQGAVLAAHTRHVAQNSAPHVELACEVICEMSALQAHRIAEQTMEDLRGRDRVGDQTAWELWLTRLLAHLPEPTPAATA